MINVDVSVKNVEYVKKITFGTLLHVIVEIVNIYYQYYASFGDYV